MNKQNQEIAEAMNILMKHNIEVMFLFKETQYHFLIRGKRNWRLYKKNQTFRISSKQAASFILYRCQKMLQSQKDP